MLTLASFQFVDWLVLGIYLLAMIAIGYAVSRKQDDETDFFLGSRNVPVWAVSLSVLATALSAATFIGAPQDAFDGNLAYLILNIGGIFGALIVALFFIPAFYRAGTLTIYGYIGKRISPNAATAVSAAFLGGRLLASGARLFMAGIAFSLLLFSETDARAVLTAIVLLGVVGTLYTAMGGIRAVIWTDVAQLIIVIGAAIVSIVLLLRAIPLPIGEIIAELRHFPTEDGPMDKLKIVDWRFDFSSTYTVWGALAFTAFNVAAYGCDHDLAQRMLTTRSPWRASASILGGILMGLPITALFMVIGLLLAIYYGRADLMGDAFPADVLSQSEKVYPQFLIHHLPAGLSGLAMAGLLAAALSSFDSAINAMAATWLADVRKSKTGHASRATVIAMGVLLTGVGMLMLAMYDADNDSLLIFALGVMAFAYTGLLGVFLTALLLPRRGSTVSVTLALIAGGIYIFLTQTYTQSWLTFIFTWTTTGQFASADELAEPLKVSLPWTMLAGAAVSFAVCALGKRKIDKSKAY